MGQLNANTPYIQCYIRNKYIFGPKDEGLTEGYIWLQVYDKPANAFSFSMRVWGHILDDAYFRFL